MHVYTNIMCEIYHKLKKYVEDIYNNIIFTYEYTYRYINTYHRYISYVR